MFRENTIIILQIKPLVYGNFFHYTMLQLIWFSSYIFPALTANILSLYFG